LDAKFQQNARQNGTCCDNTLLRLRKNAAGPLTEHDGGACKKRVTNITHNF
jgi:hypothetical protein